MAEKEELKQEGKPDTKSEFAPISAEALAESQEYAREQKDEWRFVIGLATGTLVLSVTFVHQIVPAPKYTEVLILGWIALLTSILACIEMARQLMRISQIFRQVKSWPKLMRQMPYDKHALIEILSALLGEKKEGDKTAVNQSREIGVGLEFCCVSDGGVAAPAAACKTSRWDDMPVVARRRRTDASKICQPAELGRLECRKDFAFNAEWNRKRYATKRVRRIFVEESEQIVVVTVYVYYL